MRTRSIKHAAASCALILLSLAVSTGPAISAPTAAQYTAELNRLSVEISKLDEDYNESRLRLARLEQQMRDLQHGKEKADQKLSGLKTTASARANAAYRVGVPGILMILFGSRSIGDFQKKMAATSRVGDWESGLMTDLEIANEKVDERAEDLKAASDNARAIKKTLGDRRAALKAREATQRSLMEKQRAAEAASRRAKGRPPAVKLPRSANAAGLPSLESLPVASGAKTALEAAFALQGKPYRWAAAGPDSFDCSGFTMYVWRKAGVSLPHSSRAQYAATKRVSREDLRPGDLVFSGHPIHHVGMYVGGGKMIHSPESGDTVGVDSLHRDYVGAGRPGV